MTFFSPHERLLIHRFLMPGVGGRFALLIAMIGCAGIATGVASLILVVSFMNGAEARLSGQIASADGHIFFTTRNKSFLNWNRINQQFRYNPNVLSSVQSRNGVGFAQLNGRVFPTDLQGIDPAYMRRNPLLTKGSTNLIGTAPLRSNTVAIGIGLASQLGVTLGEHISLTLPKFSNGSLDLKSYDATVAGIIDTEIYSFDSRRIILPLADLESIDSSSRLEVSVRLKDSDKEATFLDSVREWLPPGVKFSSWKDVNRSLFVALAQERLAMTVIISFVTVVALFNITSSLMMMVRHKSREVAILLTMGVSRASIIKVFMTVGFAIAFVGEIVGLGIGFLIKSMKDSAVSYVIDTFGGRSVELNVLLSLPLAISYAETGWVIAIVSLGALASTIYPAVRAASINPANVLRYT